MKKEFIVSVTLEPELVLWPINGQYCIWDEENDTETEERNILDAFKREIKNLSSLEAEVGDEVISTEWIKGMIGLLQEFLRTVETHNQKVKSNLS